MSTSTEHDLAIPRTVNARVLQEGYGPGAWHGPDLKRSVGGCDT